MKYQFVKQYGFPEVENFAWFNEHHIGIQGRDSGLWIYDSNLQFLRSLQAPHAKRGQFICKSDSSLILASHIRSPDNDDDLDLHELTVWDVNTGHRIVNLFEDSTVFAMSMCWGSNHRVACLFTDWTIKIFDTWTFSLLNSWKIEHRDVAREFAWNSSGPYLLVVQVHTSTWVTVWNTEIGDPVLTLEFSMLRDVTAKWSLDGLELIVALPSGTLLIYDWQVYLTSFSNPETIKLSGINTENRSAQRLRLLALNSDSQLIAGIVDKTTLHVWNAKTGEIVMTVNHDGSVTALEWHPQRNLLAMAKNNVLDILNVDDQSIAAQYYTSDIAGLTSIAWQPNGTRILGLYTGSSETASKFHLWDFTDGQVDLVASPLIRDYWTSISAIDWSPNDDLIAIGYTSRDIEVWDWQEDTMPYKFRVTEAAGIEEVSRIPGIHTLAWSKNTNRLAIAHHTQIDLWNRSNNTLNTFIVENTPIDQLQWTPNDIGFVGTVLSIDDTLKSKLKYWLLDKHNDDALMVPGEELHRPTWNHACEKIARVVNVNDGLPFRYELVISSILEKKDIATYQFPEMTSINNSVWSPNDRLIAAMTDEKIYIIDTESGQEISQLELPMHTHYYTARWKPDGSKLAIGTDRGVVRVWNVSTGQVEDELYHVSDINAIDWHPQENILVIGISQKLISIWSGEISIS